MNTDKHLAKLLAPRSYPRKLYFFSVPPDAWFMVLRPCFLHTEAGYAAWAPPEKEVQGVSDCPHLEGQPNVAYPLPSMGSLCVTRLTQLFGQAAELSAGWAAAVREAEAAEAFPRITGRFKGDFGCLN